MPKPTVSQVSGARSLANTATLSTNSPKSMRANNVTIKAIIKNTVIYVCLPLFLRGSLMSRVVWALSSYGSSRA